MTLPEDWEEKLLEANRKAAAEEKKVWKLIYVITFFFFLGCLGLACV